jgi:hypothetical protein
MPVSLRVREQPAQLTFSFSDESVSGFIQQMAGSWAVTPSQAIAGGVRVKYTMAVKVRRPRSVSRTHEPHPRSACCQRTASEALRHRAGSTCSQACCHLRHLKYFFIS